MFMKMKWYILVVFLFGSLKTQADKLKCGAPSSTSPVDQDNVQNIYEAIDACNEAFATNTHKCAEVEKIPKVGKVPLKISIVKGSVWDFEGAQTEIKGYLATVENMLGFDFEVQVEVLDDQNLVKGFNQGSGSKSTALVNQIGNEKQVTLIFTGHERTAKEKRGEFISQAFGETSTNAFSVAKPFDRTGAFKYDAAVLTRRNVGRVDYEIAHELIHVLGGQTGLHTHSFNPFNVMAWWGGCSFTDPWKSAVYSNRHVQKY